MHIRAAVEIVTALCFAMRAGAQDIAPGDRLRVHHATACCGVTTTTGRLVSVGPSALLLNTRGGLTVTVPRDSIRGVERGEPGDNHIYLGTAIGMAAGAVMGYEVGSTHPGCTADRPCLPFLVGFAAALPGALAGGVVGWLVGSRFRREDWQPVDLPVRVGVQGDARRFRIVMTRLL